MTANLPVQLVGSAFEIPPSSSPLPAFRTELNISEDQLDNIELALVEKINAQFQRHGLSGIKVVSDLYPAIDVFLTTLPELDPFGPRLDVAYVGPVFALPQQQEVEWQTDATRVFVYLRSSVQGCEAMLETLDASNWEVVCMMPDCPTEWTERFDQIRFCRYPLQLGVLLPKAHLIVTSGVGLLTTALLSAVPVVYMPQTVEQGLIGHAGQRTGALTVTGNSGSAFMPAVALKLTMDDPSFREQAMTFATRYLSSSFENNARSVVLARPGHAEVHK